MNKRHFLTGAAGTMAAGLFSAQARAAETDSCGRVAKPATFVLVPGAFGGGFDFDPVSEILRARGHRVFALTLTGLAERSHLLSPRVGLETHIADVVNTIRFNELSDIVLAGHSYGGMVITGAADRVSGRVASLVYLDAFVPENGDSAASIAQDPNLASTGLTLPLTEEMAAMVGIPSGELWRYTPHPMKTMTDPIRLTGAYMSTARRTYVRALGFPPFAATYARVTTDSGWETFELDSGHGLMAEKPKETAEILEGAWRET